MGFIADRRMNPEGWGTIQSYQDYKEQFQIANNLDVSKNYSEAKQYFYDLAHSAQYSKLTEQLNFEQRTTKNGRKLKGTSAKLDQQVDIWINQIRNAKITEYKFKVQNGSTQINQSVAQNLCAKWENVIKLMRAQQWTNLNTELNILENYVQQLNASIKSSNSGDLIDLTNILGEGDAYTIASRLEGLLSRIQGEVLEQEVKKFLAKKIPTQVAVTGSINVAGGGKIKPDLIASLLDYLELKNEQGQVTYIFKNGEIYDGNGVPATGTVTLTDYELKGLLENSLGFSAKTTSGATTFHQGYNIEKLIQDSLGQGDPQTAVWQLLHFYQLGLQNVPNLDAYQRYAVSRLAIQILGRNNAYIITKNEIIPTYQYVDKLLKKGLYFGNKKIPVKSGDTLNSNFGSTNILGPKV